MSDELNLPRGPTRYIIERCPYCKRRLAEWFEGDDHVTILHGKAAVEFGISVPIEDFNAVGPHKYTGSPREGTATCLRWACRIRTKLGVSG
jgi:hypothetical protein